VSGSEYFGEVVCAIGAFDGVHLGHQYLFSQAQQQADAAGLPLLVVTFDRDPDELFSPGREHRKLLSNAERLARLGSADNGGRRSYLSAAAGGAVGDAAVGGSAAGGAAAGGAVSGSERAVLAPGSSERAVLALPFEHALADLSPADFMDQVLISRCQPRAIHVGADFRFGSKAAGDVRFLEDWALRHDARTFGHELFDDGGQPVTASRIRDCLAAGQLAEANRLLTRPHHLRGQIVKGRGFGREMGFPTANIAVIDGVMPPADGVYAGFFELGGELLGAAISVGVPLTFEGLEASIEVYVLDFEGDLYDKEANVYFLEYLRPMIAFADVDALMTQIGRDVERSRGLAAEARETMG